MGRIADAIAALRGERTGSLAAYEAVMRDRGYASPAGVQVTQETALRHSAVWASRRLRSNVLGMLPVDAYRTVNGRAVQVAKPEVLVRPFPGGSVDAGWSFGEWRWAAEWDRTGYGNHVGIIHSTNALGKPAVIEPVSMADTSIIVNGRRIKEVRVSGEKVPLEFVWLETVYRPSGCPLGLSPLQAAAYSIGGYLAAQKFAMSWYDQDRPFPKGVLKNVEDRMPDPAATKAVKAQFKASIANGDIFVTGRDWEWKAEKVDAESAGFIETFNWGVTDIARFMDVPSDLIDSAVSGSSVTYASMTQRNLQFLVMSMQSTITRDENTLSYLLATPRYVKQNTAALLRMDEEARHRILAGRITARTITPNEARALDDLEPLTDEQYAEFDRLFGNRNAQQPAQAKEWSAPQ